MPRVGRSTAVALSLFGAYLLLSIGLWWQVWSGHPTSTYLCACGDPGQYLWFFAAPAEAIRQGHLPFFTAADYHPGGVNLLDNPGVLGLAVAAAPITWAFGPVAAVNVVLTVTPAVSALAGYVLLRRWTAWWPAAAIGGLFYGFSPLVVASLEYVHLQVAFLAFPPLIVLCIDELLVRQQRSPTWIGLALAALVAAQFLVSPEMLVITALGTAIGVVSLVVHVRLHHPETLRQRFPHALRGTGVAAVTTVALLGYPIWLTLDGPRHTVGAPWSFIAATGNALKEFFVPGRQAYGRPFDPAVYGYAGQPGPPAGYLGITVVAAAVVAAVALWHEGLVRLAVAVAVVLAILSLGDVLVVSPLAVLSQRHDLATQWWLPWTALAHVPLVDEASPSRISAALDLLVALVCAIGLDRLVVLLAVRQRRLEGSPTTSLDPGSPNCPGSRAVGAPPHAVDPPLPLNGHRANADGSANASAPVPGPEPQSAPRRRSWAGRLPDAIGVAAALAVLVPVGLAYRLPLRTQTVTPPVWYSTTAEHLPAGSVLLALPWGLSETSAWQAMTGMRFVMAGGDAFVPGPRGRVVDTPAAASADGILTDLSIYARAPASTPTALRTVRRAMVRWGVTTVAVTRTTGEPTSAVAFLTATLGMLPVRHGAVWVWDDVGRAPPPLRVPAAAMAMCQPLTATPSSAARCMVHLARTSALP